MSGFEEGIPTVAIRLGGKDRTLGFTLGAMERVQDALGSLEFSATNHAAMVRQLPVFIWACMDTETRKEFSADDIKEMIHLGNMQALADKVVALFTASVPEQSEGNAPSAPATKKAAGRRPSTSRGSGRSRSTTSGSAVTSSGP